MDTHFSVNPLEGSRYSNDAMTEFARQGGYETPRAYRKSRVSQLEGAESARPVGFPTDDAMISEEARQAAARAEEARPDSGEATPEARNPLVFPVPMAGVAEAAEDEESRAPELEEAAAPKDLSGEPLDEEEQRQLESLERRDAEVRQHEQAHLAAAGAYARSGARLEYETGPDGKRYAVAGEVSIDISEEDSPEATVRKMQVVRRAALAPADPSPTDRSVAARASLKERAARREMAEEAMQGDKEPLVNASTPTGPEASRVAERPGMGAESEGQAGVVGNPNGVGPETASGISASAQSTPASSSNRPEMTRADSFQGPEATLKRGNLLRPYLPEVSTSFVDNLA